MLNSWHGELKKQWGNFKMIKSFKAIQKSRKVSKLLSLLFAGLTAVLAANHAYALPYKDCSGGVAVNGLFDYWHKDQDGKMQLTKTITNNSCEAALYYIVKIYRVENPFAKDGKKEKDVLLTPKEMTESVLPSKSRLVLAPKHKEAVNLYMPKGNKSDKLSFYRIDFQPVIPSKKYGFDIDEKTENKAQAQTTIGMGIATAVVVEPSHPDYTYSAVQKANELTLTNKGNALLLANLTGQCVTAKDSKESKKDGKNQVVTDKTTPAKSQSAKNSKVVILQCNDNGYATKQIKIYPQQQQTIDLSVYKDQVTLLMSMGYKHDTRYYKVS